MIIVYGRHSDEGVVQDHCHITGEYWWVTHSSPQTKRKLVCPRRSKICLLLWLTNMCWVGFIDGKTSLQMLARKKQCKNEPSEADVRDLTMLCMAISKKERKDNTVKRQKKVRKAKKKMFRMSSLSWIVGLSRWKSLARWQKAVFLFSSIMCCFICFSSFLCLLNVDSFAMIEGIFVST